MLFHTWIFSLFFLFIYLIYIVVRKTRFKNAWLLFASYLFYAWWSPVFLLLILYSTCIDYLAVLKMSRSGRRKIWLLLSLINNLSLLCVFKYSGFIVDGLNTLLGVFGVHYTLQSPGLLLPVGIFYTFQSMSYTIDYYRGHIPKEPSFICYATFVSFFPQLVAGPIERARNLLPQLRVAPPISKQNIFDGLSLFVTGLFKKVVLADSLGLYVDKIYDMPGQYQAPALILATFAFSWQIYFDFSGYTDMARGVARALGYNIMLNFNNPYLATSLKDFWSRWHISLSTWFRDYVYIPLGGNRRGTLCTYRNIFLTMIISGLWHGAAWTFVIWGAMHAFAFMLTRALENTGLGRVRIPRFVRQVLVFTFVTFVWIFFRATCWADVCLIVTRILFSGFGDPAFPLVLLVFIFTIWVYQFIHESRFNEILRLAPVRVGIIIAMILSVTLFASGSKAFIYFLF